MGSHERVGREAEHPLRDAEFSGTLANRFDLAVAKTVEIPKIGAIRDEVERSVGTPFGLEYRFGRTAGYARGVFDSAVGTE